TSMASLGRSRVACKRRGRLSKEHGPCQRHAGWLAWWGRGIGEEAGAQNKRVERGLHGRLFDAHGEAMKRLTNALFAQRFHDARGQTLGEALGGGVVNVERDDSRPGNSVAGLSVVLKLPGVGVLGDTQVWVAERQ